MINRPICIQTYLPPRFEADLRAQFSPENFLLKWLLTSSVTKKNAQGGNFSQLVYKNPDSQFKKSKCNLKVQSPVSRTIVLEHLNNRIKEEGVQPALST